MKKYIIKYADGREVSGMQNSYKSRNEASDALLSYLYGHNEHLSVNDDDYPSLFDFKIEEVDVKDVNEVITDFNSARKALGLDIDFQSPEYMIKVADFVEAINSKHIDALIALNKLFTLAEAWNKEDEFVPNYSDWKQDKWFPWFKYDEDVEKFVCADTINAATAASAHLGSRLCFKTQRRAEQFGKQFIDLYNKVFL